MVGRPFRGCAALDEVSGRPQGLAQHSITFTARPPREVEARMGCVDAHAIRVEGEPRTGER
jgi:hypothetical protein